MKSEDVYFVNKTKEVVIIIALPWKWDAGGAVGTDGNAQRAHVSQLARVLQVRPETTQGISPKNEWDGRSNKMRVLVATKRGSLACVWMQSTVKVRTNVIVYPGLVGPGALPLLGYFPVTASSPSILDAALNAILPHR